MALAPAPRSRPRRRLARARLALFACIAAIGASAGWLDAQKKVTFEEHVRPIVESNCIGCHNAGRSSGGLALDDYDRVFDGGSSGDVVKAGDADGSKLYRVVAHLESPKMPPGAKLDGKAIALIKRWVDGGALRNNKSKARKSADVNAAFAVAAPSRGKPDGPPPLPPRLSLDPTAPGARPNPVNAIAASPWAPLCAVGAHKQILLYDDATLALRGVLPFPEGTPYVVRFSGDGSKLLAAGGENGRRGRVVVWDVRTAERVLEIGKEFDAVLAADMSPDQTRIALGGPGKIVRVYDTANGKLRYELTKHTDWITALEFSPDGTLLATGDRAGNLHVWEAHDGADYLTPKAHKGRVTSIAWRADSNAFATAGEDRAVVLWRTEDGRQLRRFTAHGGGTLAVRYHPDGRLATAGRDRTIKLWKADGKALRTLKGMTDAALSVAFLADGDHVLGGDWRGVIRRWRMKDGKATTKRVANPPAIAKRLAGLKRERAKLEAALETKRRSAAKAASVIRGRRARIDDLEARRRPLAARVKKLRTRANAARDRYLASAGAIDPASRAAGGSLDRVKATLALLRRHHDRLAAVTRANAPVRRLSNEIARTKAALKNARTAFAKAQRHVDKARADVERNATRTERWREERRLADRAASYAKARADLTRAEQARRAFTEWKRETESEIEELENNEEKWERAKPRYARNIKLVEQRRGRLDRLEAETRAQLQLARSMLAYAKNASELGGYVVRLEAGVGKATADMTGTAALFARSTKRIAAVAARLAAERKAATEQVKRLESLVASAAAGAKEGRETIAASRADLAALEKRIAAAKDRWQDLQMAIAEADDKRDAADRALTAAQRAFASAKAELDDQRRRLDDVLAKR